MKRHSLQAAALMSTIMMSGGVGERLAKEKTTQTQLDKDKSRPNEMKGRLRDRQESER